MNGSGRHGSTVYYAAYILATYKHWVHFFMVSLYDDGQLVAQLSYSYTLQSCGLTEVFSLLRVVCLRENETIDLVSTEK